MLDITSVELFPAPREHAGPGGNVVAYCKLTVSGVLVVNDVKIIRLRRGGFLVALPSKALKFPCPDCTQKNPLKAHFCNRCGVRLRGAVIDTDESGREKLYADVVHPLDPDTRHALNRVVVDAYHAWERRKPPGVPDATA